MLLKLLLLKMVSHMMLGPLQACAWEMAITHPGEDHRNQKLVAGHRLNFGGVCRGCGKATAGGSRPWGGVDIRGGVDDEVAGGRGGRALPDPFTMGAKPEVGGGRGGSALSVAITMGKEDEEDEEDEVDGGRRGSALSVSFTAGEKGEVGGGVGGGQSWNDL
ncbi:hypothetical protein BKA64DRAFT_640986 [Cadophora sp. MPI-SDFR-AT-0126]|nr:hypothetical protein BKA64DRAFT_640986 [Leotiomycetes sp. MPI-SDFR-AT-0126]